jgi:hypothetical protein
MNKSTKMIVTAAALAGLYSGALALKARADDTSAGTPAAKDAGKQNSCNGKSGCNAGTTPAKDAGAKNGCSSKSSCNGTDKASSNSQDAGQSAGKTDKDKSSCSGKDGCSGTTAPAKGADKT